MSEKKKTREEYLESFKQGCDKFYAENGSWYIGLIRPLDLVHTIDKLQTEIGISRSEILRILAEIEAKYNPNEA